MYDSHSLKQCIGEGRGNFIKELFIKGYAATVRRRGMSAWTGNRQGTGDAQCTVKVCESVAMENLPFSMTTTCNDHATCVVNEEWNLSRPLSDIVVGLWQATAMLRSRTCVPGKSVFVLNL